MKVYIYINGKEVNPKHQSDSVEELLVAGLKDRLEDLLGSMRCSVHGTSPEVRGEGESLDNITFTITSTCCENFISEIRTELDRVFKTP